VDSQQKPQKHTETPGLTTNPSEESTSPETPPIASPPQASNPAVAPVNGVAPYGLNGRAASEPHPDQGVEVVASAEPASTESAPSEAASTESAPSGAEVKESPAENPNAPMFYRQRPLIAEWAVTLLILMFVTTTLVQAFVIPTGSMESTLLIGDYLLVDKLSYAPHGTFSGSLLPFTEVKRGDIVVFRYPGNLKETFVKRVIGVPGDRIKMVQKQVWRNGKPIEEPYKQHTSPIDDPYRDNFPNPSYFQLSERAIEMLEAHVKNGELIVPPKSYFVLGDNRDNSLDSRFWGFVPRENIIGKPLLVYWSFAATTDQLSGSTFSVPYLWDVARNLITKTRWNRSFQLIHGHTAKD
jgi:signal peptidase I